MPSSDLKSPAVRDSIDTLRLLAADAVERAQSGHPGTPMEAAPIAYLLFAHHLRHNPQNPDWPGRDRFVLSCGHASMLLYGILHLSGYDLSLDDLKNFRQLGSRTPGHPEYRHTPGVETTTGPLGQGIGVAVGMAMGGRLLSSAIDRELFSYRVYTLCSDGDLMEGVASEAASLAGHLSLGNLTCIYLDNRITIEGSTDLAFSEDVGTRFLAYGWQVERVDGENLAEIDTALHRARRDPRPSLIIARTHIGFGAPTKQDSAEAHGAPLGAEELSRTKVFFGRDPKLSFEVPESVRQHLAGLRHRGEGLEREWRETMEKRRDIDPLPVRTWEAACEGLDLDDLALPQFTPEQGPMATRKASGTILNRIAAQLPLLVGGSADLAPSNNTELQGQGSFGPGQAGRNIHFGVREHAMGTILNGLCHTPGVRPFGATFLIFSDYLRPPLRLAAMMELAPIYVFTHDSIGLGEDGPTHQPVEQLASLRALPNLMVLRPCDANETAEAWRLALEKRDGPTALVLSRQNLPILERKILAPAQGTRRGGYILAAEEGPLRAIFIASGSEVHLALAARDRLQCEGLGVRVVSLPCWDLFSAQEETYRQEVLPPSCTLRVAVEAASPFGWERFIGLHGRTVTMPGFGASGPAADLQAHFGFSVENLVAQVKGLL